MSVNEWMNEWIDKWMNEWLIYLELTIDYINEIIYIYRMRGLITREGIGRSIEMNILFRTYIK